MTKHLYNICVTCNNIQTLRSNDSKLVEAPRFIIRSFF